MAALASDGLRHFPLLWNRWTEFNETWQEARSKCLLPSLCYWGRSQKQDSRPGLWLADIFDFFSEIAERNSTILDRKQNLNVLYQVCVFWADLKDGRPGLWLPENFSTSLMKLLNGIQWHSTGSKISKSSTKLVFFGLIGKTRWPPQPLIGRDIFDFFSETAEQNSTKLDRKDDLNVLYQVCVFWVDRKNKMAAQTSNWPRHFRLLFWNRWTENRRNLTGSKISTSFTKSVFFGPIGKKKDGRHGPWLAETFLTSPLKLLNGIQRNLTGSKISTSSTKLCFSVWWVNKNYRPGRSVKKVAHCTLVHDIWSFLSLVYVFI